MKIEQSIKELRQILQKHDEEEYPYLILVRRVSIYFTKLLLKTGISANQVTILSFVTTIVAGIFLTIGDPAYWIIGSLVLYLFMVLDCVDGEIARYYKSASKLGEYLDAIFGFIGMYIYIPICLCLGIYSELQDHRVVITGLLVVASIFLLHGSGLLAYYTLQGHGLLWDNIQVESNKSKMNLARAMKYGYAVFGGERFIIAILVVSLIDCFVAPATIRYIPFMTDIKVNARWLYFILYGIANMTGGILRVYQGIKESHKLSS